MRITHTFAIPCTVRYPGEDGVEVTGEIKLVCRTFSRSFLEEAKSGDEGEIGLVKRILVGVRHLEGTDSQGRDLSDEKAALDHVLDDLLLLPIVIKTLSARLADAKLGN